MDTIFASAASALTQAMMAIDSTSAFSVLTSSLRAGSTPAWFVSMPIDAQQHFLCDFGVGCDETREGRSVMEDDRLTMQDR